MTAAKRKEDLTKIRWSSEEDATLAKVWPCGTVPEILAALPGRSIGSCGRRAHELKIVCTNRRHLAKVVSPIFVRDGVEGKACVACLDWMPLENFARHETCAGGRRNICTTCQGRRAYKSNPQARIASVLRYQASHPESVRVHRTNAAARRHERGGVHHGRHGVTVDDLRAIREVFGDLCVYCGEHADTLDHVVPLSRGGKHVVENLVPACADCNRRKHAKTPDEWALSKKVKGE